MARKYFSVKHWHISKIHRSINKHLEWRCILHVYIAKLCAEKKTSSVRVLIELARFKKESLLIGFLC